MQKEESNSFNTFTFPGVSILANVAREVYSLMRSGYYYLDLDACL